MARYSTILRDQNEVPISGAVVSVINPTTGALATLTDDLGASILNPITTGALGDVTFNAADNVYRLEYRINGIERRIDDVIVGSPSAFAGPAGPAFATYFTLATFKAAATSNATQILQDPAFAFGQFNWETANAPYTADNINVIKADSTALSVGAWVRQKALGLNFDGRSVDAKLRDVVSVFDARFAGGAVGNGTTDDTAAFLAALTALPSGGTLNLGNGNTFKLSQSLILTKPVRIVGGAMEQNVLRFSKTGTYQSVGDGSKAAVIVTHTETAISGHLGDARRTDFTGFCVSIETPSPPANVRGIVICAPSYLDKVRVENFTSTGFAVMAGNRSPLDGIANQTMFYGCIAQYNSGDGFYFLGDDANANVLLGCFPADNGGWGLNDDSLLGCTVSGGQADGNALGGYKTNSLTTNASTFIGAYSETPGTGGHFSVSPLSVILGNQGVAKPKRATGGVSFRGLPSAAAYISQPVRVATTDDIAEALGGAGAPGPAVELGENGLQWRVRSGESLLRWSGDYDVNYVTLAYNGAFCMRLPKGSVTANIKAGFPWFENGIVIGGAGKTGMDSGTAAPTTGAYTAGFFRWNEAPAVDGSNMVILGWSCTVSGAPGTWVAIRGSTVSPAT